MFTSYLLTFFLKYATISIYRKEVKVTKYYKGYKVRLFPTPEQEELMWKHIHACRFIWNSILDEYKVNYRIFGTFIKYNDFLKYITESKDFYSWLNEVSRNSLDSTAHDLYNNLLLFFNKKSKFPNFKSKKSSKTSFPIREDKRRFYFTENYVKIEKLGKVTYRCTSIKFNKNELKYCNPRISYINKKWILSFSIECESQALELTEKSIGIDLGIKELATCSFGEEQIVFHNINKSRKVKQLERKLKHIQRNLSRKYLKCNKDEYKRLIKSKNIVREEEKLKEIYYRLANIRNNHIHQITHQIIMLRPKRVGMEDLNISEIIKNKHLYTSIKDCKFYGFIRQIKYKCLINEIEFIQVPRFYPSSKTCSNCSSYKKDLKLSDRVYKCPECGLVINRDFNAARNLENYVLEQQ